MQWPDLVAQLSYYCQQEQPDASFTAATPTFVNHAELRCYRELDFAAASGQNTSLATTALSKTVDLTVTTGQTIHGTAVAYQFPVVVETLAARVGNRWIPFQLTSLDWLDFVWPDETVSAPPVPGLAYYHMLDSQTARLAPVPDMIYPLRVTGTWRPAPMSADNPITWLGTYLPDLLFNAVMIEAMAYQRDFGAQSDNPQAALSWEAKYQDCKRNALREEALRKGLGPDFQPYAPAPLAHPPMMPAPAPQA
jgi:hypothetical protein